MKHKTKYIILTNVANLLIAFLYILSGLLLNINIYYSVIFGIGGWIATGFTCEFWNELHNER